MPSLTPYIGRSNDRLTAMLNKDNNKTLVEGVDFTYGSVTAIIGDGGRNSMVTLTPVPGTSYPSAQDIKYWRLGIDAVGRLPAGSTDSVPVPQLPFSIHGILPVINTALGLSLTPAEVEDTVYTDEAPSYAIKVVNGSLAWYPSTYSFPATNTGEATPLSSIIVNTVLSGLVYVEQPVVA
jgi:hypothetical protein